MALLGARSFLGTDLLGLLLLQMSVSKRARKASSDLDQASVSPSEEENSESSSESEKTSDQVSKRWAPQVRGGVMHGRELSRAVASRLGLFSSLLSAQDFTPEKKAVVRVPRRGPLAGRKKKVEVFVLFFFLPHTHLGETLRASLQGCQPLSTITVQSGSFWRRIGRRPQGDLRHLRLRPLASLMASARGSQVPCVQSTS